MALSMSDREKHTLPRRLFLRTSSAVLPVGITALAYGGGTGLPAKTSVRMEDLERIHEILRDSKPYIWVFTGDSITHGAKHTAGQRSYSEIFEERLRWEMTSIIEQIRASNAIPILHTPNPIVPSLSLERKKTAGLRECDSAGGRFQEGASC